MRKMTLWKAEFRHLYRRKGREPSIELEYELDLGDAENNADAMREAIEWLTNLYVSKVTRVSDKEEDIQQRALTKAEEILTNNNFVVETNAEGGMPDRDGCIRWCISKQIEE